MDLLIREITPAEVPTAVDLYLTARQDMHQRQGHQPGPVTAEDRALNERGYRHIHQTGILRVAEVDGRMAGVCCAIVRDQIWFLSGFWVHPTLQGQGVGGPLLREVWRAGVERGSSTHFVWSSANPDAMAAYMKQSMLPGYQILAFAGPLLAPPLEPSGYDLEPLPLATAVAVDERVRSTGREVDHLFWQMAPGVTGTLVTRGGRPAGYFYRRGGVIGPLVWLEPDAATAVLSLAIGQAAAAAPEVKLFATGATPEAIRMALGAGLKLTGFSHFLTTAPFGMPDRYLPSGPLLY